MILTENVVLHGRGAENYHFDRNQNLVYKLENFAGSPAPANPMDGQLWWDVQNESLQVYNEFGSPTNNWESVVPTGAGVGFAVAPGDGLEQTGSPVQRGYEPAGSPLTLEMQVKTGNTGLQNIVAVGSLGAGTNSTIWTSQDAINWTQRTRAVGAPVNHVRAAYSPTLGRFVVTHATRHVSYSDDGGETWNYQTNAFPASGGASPDYTWYEIEWIDSYGLFIAANQTGDADEEKLAYSADGLNWTLIPTSVFAAQPTTEPGFSKIVYIDSIDVVAIFCTGPSNNQPNAAHIVWSRDGINWKLQPNIATLSSPWTVWTGTRNGFVYSDTLDLLMYIGNSGSNGIRVRPYTYDVSAAGSPLFAAGWTLQSSSPTWPEYALYRDAEWFGGTTNRYVYVGADTNNTTVGSPDPDLANVIYSDNGTTFEMVSLGPAAPSGTTPLFNRARYIPSLDMMIIGTGTQGGSPALGLTWYSTNGRSWTRSSAFPDATSFTSINDIAYGEATADGVTVNPNSIEINTTEVSHDALGGFVTSEHVDHSDVIITGDGLLEVSLIPSQVGSLTNNRTMHINPGLWIQTNANDIEVTANVTRVTGPDAFYGTKNFQTPKSIRVGDGTAAQPAFAFASHGYGTGFYRSGTVDFGISTASLSRFQINEANNRTLRSDNTTYETLVTDDDDIPNKQYVDDVVGGSTTGATTENVFASRNSYTGTTVSTNHAFPLSISGLTPGKKYLVSVWGITRNNGTGTGTFGQVRITSVHASPPTSGVLYSGPTFNSINWPDGHFPQHSQAVIVAPAGGTIYGYTDYRTGGGTPTEWMNAYYMTAVQIET
jgi:hypothetical protein